MTVAELVEKLKAMPQDANVRRNDSEWGVDDIDRVALDPYDDKVVILS